MATPMASGRGSITRVFTPSCRSPWLSLRTCPTGLPSAGRRNKNSQAGGGQRWAVGSKACLSHDSGLCRAESFSAVSGPGPGSQGAERIRHSGLTGRRNRSQGRAWLIKKRCRSGGGVLQTAARTFAKAEACDKYGPWRSVNGWAYLEGGVPAGAGCRVQPGTQAGHMAEEAGSVGNRQPRQVVFQISVLERLSIPDAVTPRPGCHHLVPACPCCGGLFHPTASCRYLPAFPRARSGRRS